MLIFNPNNTSKCFFNFFLTFGSVLPTIKTNDFNIIIYIINCIQLLVFNYLYSISCLLSFNISKCDFLNHFNKINKIKKNQLLFILFKFSSFTWINRFLSSFRNEPHFVSLDGSFDSAFFAIIRYPSLRYIPLHSAFC